MKTKLGEAQKLSKLKFEQYKTLFKKYIENQVNENPEEIIEFVLIEGTAVPWQGGGDKNHPFLYFGDIQKWRKNIKEMKLELTDFVYGHCQVQKKGGEIEILLDCRKGKLQSPSKFNPLAKIFHTKFKPKVSLKVVDKIKGTPDAHEEAAEQVDIEAKDLGEMAKTIVLDTKDFQKDMAWRKGVVLFAKAKKWLELNKTEVQNGNRGHLKANEKIVEIARYVQSHLKTQRSQLEQVEQLINELEKDPTNQELPAEIEALFAQLN